MKKANARVSSLYRFTGKIPPETLHRVYKVAVEPIVLYGSEVLYENYTIMEQKKLLSLNWNAIKIAYNLPRHTPAWKCHEIAGTNILERWEKRHDNFVRSNAYNTSIRHTETHTTSEGRKIPVRPTFISKNAPHTT